MGGGLAAVEETRFGQISRAGAGPGDVGALRGLLAQPREQRGMASELIANSRTP